jgi:hypothetical protein
MVKLCLKAHGEANVATENERQEKEKRTKLIVS